MYRRSNIKTLKALLSSLNQKAKTEVRKELQPEADKQIEEMIAQLEAMLKKAKSDKPEAADISELLKTIEEAEALYDKASVNVGTDIGQYGAFEVENLRQEIAAAKEMDKFTPQNEINDEVDALEAAMIEVRNSLRQEDMLYFYDKATGIYVIARLHLFRKTPSCMSGACPINPRNIRQWKRICLTRRQRRFTIGFNSIRMSFRFSLRKR